MTAPTADDVRSWLLRGDVRAVRIAWCDWHGLMRGKTLMPAAAAQALHQLFFTACILITLFRDDTITAGLGVAAGDLTRKFYCLEPEDEIAFAKRHSLTTEA